MPTPVPSGPRLTDQARLKIALMTIINANLRSRFRSLAEAAAYADVSEVRLYRLSRGRYTLFSIDWLFNLANAADIPIRISVDPQQSGRDR